MDLHECGTKNDYDDDKVIEFKVKDEMKIQYPDRDQKGDDVEVLKFDDEMNIQYPVRDKKSDNDKVFKVDIPYEENDCKDVITTAGRKEMAFQRLTSATLKMNQNLADNTHVAPFYDKVSESFFEVEHELLPNAEHTRNHSRDSSPQRSFKDKFEAYISKSEAHNEATQCPDRSTQRHLGDVMTQRRLEPKWKSLKQKNILVKNNKRRDTLRTTNLIVNTRTETKEELNTATENVETLRSEANKLNDDEVFEDDNSLVEEDDCSLRAITKRNHNCDISTQRRLRDVIEASITDSVTGIFNDGEDKSLFT